MPSPKKGGRRTCRSAGADLQVMLAAASTRGERTSSVHEVLDHVLASACLGVPVAKASWTD